MADDKQANWQYSPEGDKEIETGLADAVDSELQKPGRKSDSKTITWTASEYIDHKQGFGWFIGLAVATLIISALTYLLTKDYLPTGVILALGLIVGIFAKRTPRNRDYELSIDGLRIDQRNFPLTQFQSYSLVHDGALLSLMLQPTKRFMPPVSVYIAPADEEKITDFLQDRLPYEDNQLDFIEKLTRSLRF